MSDVQNSETLPQEQAMPVIEIDAYAPAKMADRVGQVGVAKSQLSALTTFALSILAGVFIALGVQLSMLVTHTATSNYGLNQLVGGVAFTLSLVLIVIAGAELFTGNCLIAMSFMARKNYRERPCQKFNHCIYWQFYWCINPCFMDIQFKSMDNQQLSPRRKNSSCCQ